MNLLNSTKKEQERILKLHLNEATSTSSSGSYETPKAWDRDGELMYNNNMSGLVGVELDLDLPNEVDITGGEIGGFQDMGLKSSCGDNSDYDSVDASFSMEEPLTLNDFTKNTDESNNFLPDSLLNLFGDVNVGGDIEIELDEEPKKMRGSRKWRK